MRLEEKCVPSSLIPDGWDYLFWCGRNKCERSLFHVRKYVCESACVCGGVLVWGHMCLCIFQIWSFLWVKMYRTKKYTCINFFAFIHFLFLISLHHTSCNPLKKKLEILESCSTFNHNGRKPKKSQMLTGNTLNIIQYYGQSYLVNILSKSWSF